MNRFTPLLKEINRKLDLPQPVKSRIILELSADLNDLFNYYLEKGYNEPEAAARAREKFEVTPGILHELTVIHQPAFRRWLDKFSETAKGRWERLLLLAAVLIIFIPSLLQILTTDFFRGASFFVWPLLGTAFLAVLLFLLKFYILFVKKDHFPGKLHRGMPLFGVLGSSALFLSVSGYFVELYSLAEKALVFATNPLLIVILNTEIPTDREILHEIPAWLIRSSAMMMTGMLTAVLAGILWYVLNLRIAKIEQAEATALLGE